MPALPLPLTLTPTLTSNLTPTLTLPLTLTLTPTLTLTLIPTLTRCLGGHTASIELLRVLSDVEKQARLPPEAVKAMRESAFALLCAFCEGNKRNQAVLLP